MKLDRKIEYRDIDFAKFSSIKIGGKSKVAIIDKIEDIKNIEKCKIIGGGNNLLVSPLNSQPLIILSKNFDYIFFEHSTLTVGGATPNGKLFHFVKKHNIGGFEFIQNLPSTLGGMLKMNAGVKTYEIFNNLISLKTENGEIDKSDIEFGYRYSKVNGIILEAKFKISQTFSHDLVQQFYKMRSNQPKEHSAGSTFKNPLGLSAGKLIQDVGLKGYRIGDVAFSNIHANFLINLRNGKFDDAIKLIELAEKRVFDRFNIKLHREICIIE